MELKYRKKHQILKGALLQNSNPNSIEILWKARQKNVFKIKKKSFKLAFKIKKNGFLNLLKQENCLKNDFSQRNARL